MSKNKKPIDSIVTLIEDPYGLNTVEISETQENAEELNLDEDLDENLNDELDELNDEFADELEETLDSSSPETSPESLTESLDDQFDKLAQVIAETVNAEEQTQLAQTRIDPETELAAQIAEDQALALEIAEQVKEAETQVPSEIPLDILEIQSCVEALLFISDKPLSLEKLHQLLEPHFDIALFREAVAALKERYQATHHGFELAEVAGGYQFRTKPGRASLAKKLVKVQTQRLSSGAMETLAIIAYKQPAMKEDVDKIRGVDSSYFVRHLIDRKLIKISGRSELPGRPMLYSTTQEFLEIFGLMNLSSLPSLRELEQMIPGSQSNNPDDEDPRVREMRRLVGEMKADRTSALHYNPKEDEKILKEIREKVTAIPTSTPYLDEMKAAETLAREAQQAVLTEESVSPST